MERTSWRGGHVHQLEEYVLSDLCHGDALPRFVAWLRHLKTGRIGRHARLIVRVHHEDLPAALIWHRQQTTVFPAWKMGYPFIETRLETGNTLSGMLVWLSSSSRRTVEPSAYVTVPHFLEYASPLHDRLVEAVMRHVTFMRSDEELYGGSEPYRHARASLLLRTNTLIGSRELARHFTVVSSR